MSDAAKAEELAAFHVVKVSKNVGIAAEAIGAAFAVRTPAGRA